MPVPAWTPADLLSGFQGLMPRGRAWRRDGGAVITQTVKALLPTFQGVIASIEALLVDTFPATSVALLPEWEASLGLPDKCTPLGATIAQQQAAVVQKLTSTGGATQEYFIAVAKTLGYTITIVEGAPDSRTWTIHSPEIAPPSVFRAGQSRAGNLLESVTSNAQLECVMNRLKPADTVLLFSYP